MPGPRPFTIHVPDDVLSDLRERLHRTRWPIAVPGTGWEEGANLAYIQRWTEFDRGGHFAAMERPEELLGDVRVFFRTLR